MTVQCLHSTSLSLCQPLTLPPISKLGSSTFYALISNIPASMKPFLRAQTSNGFSFFQLLVPLSGYHGPGSTPVLPSSTSNALLVCMGPLVKSLPKGYASCPRLTSREPPPPQYLPLGKRLVQDKPGQEESPFGNHAGFGRGDCKQ